MYKDIAANIPLIEFYNELFDPSGECMRKCSLHSSKAHDRPLSCSWKCTICLCLYECIGVSGVYEQFSLEMRESLRNSPVSFEIPSSIMCVDFLFLCRRNSGTTTNTTIRTAIKPPINVFRKFQNILTVDSAQSESGT